MRLAGALRLAPDAQVLVVAEDLQLHGEVDLAQVDVRRHVEHGGGEVEHGGDRRPRPACPTRPERPIAGVAISAMVMLLLPHDLDQF